MTLRDELDNDDPTSITVPALTAAIVAASLQHGTEITAWARSQATRIAALLRTPPALPAAQIVADIPPRLLARHTANLVGLTDGHAAAVDRLFRGSIADGVTPRHALRVSGRKARQLLRWRTDTIAITERTRAVNMGRQIRWEEAIADGDIPASAVKRWRTRQDSRVDPVCDDLDGVAISIGGDFDVTVGVKEPFTTRTPPAHARCRCRIVLESK